VPGSRNIPYAENHGFLKSYKSQLGFQLRISSIRKERKFFRGNKLRLAIPPTKNRFLLRKRNRPKKEEMKNILIQAKFVPVLLACSAFTSIFRFIKRLFANL
jgi:hypothetical protein